jgi:predicted 2-oxoglutarate/Fe(II)-dependent dioxygenase YbiX
MPSADTIDLHVVRNFLDFSTCRNLIEAIRHGEHHRAITYGKSDSGTVDERTRKVKRATLDSQIVNQVAAQLREHLTSLREYFDIPVKTIEEPQFLWYRPGDFFVAHQDGNTKLIQLESDRLRRISLSIFLNHQVNDGQANDVLPESYSGGSLVFTDRFTGERHEMPGEAGKLVAFRSELTHEVTPIRHGERFAIVTWCRIVG